MTAIPRFIRAHAYFLLFYGLIFAVFLWPLLLFQKTFIFGDYWQQHYPWAFEYARQLKAGTFPYWLPGVAGGFPLVAEGQVGAYYPLHLIFYRWLPFSLAYTAMILLHVAIGGKGFYVYGLKTGMSREASTWLAILFSFSSAYGGCFSNTAVLRVMAWLPWSMVCWMALCKAPRNKRLLWVSLIGIQIALMATAGAPQMALYAVIYMTVLWMWEYRGKFLLELTAAGLIGALLSIPQWAATLELMSVSVRSGENASFALWGSVLPPALISILFPKWGMFFSVAFYVGAASFLLFMISWVTKKDRFDKIHLGLAGFFILLALGKYGPFFWCATGFFRNPSKWLFFSTVSLAIMAARALDKIPQIQNDKRLRTRATLVLAATSFLAIVMPLLAQAGCDLLAGRLSAFARQSAQDAFSGKQDPIHDISYYQAKADALQSQLAGLFSYVDRWNLVAIALIILSAGIIWKTLQVRSSMVWQKVVLPLALIIDLTIFGSYIGAGFTGNAREYPRSPDPGLLSAIHTRQDSDDSTMIGWGDDNEPEILPANTNLLYNVDHAGGYSPLLIKRYYELSKDLGISDSSLGRRSYSEEVWKKEAGVVKILGISQILGERGVRDLEDPMPLVWMVHDWREIPDEKERLSFLKGDDFRPAETAVVEDREFEDRGSSGEKGVTQVVLKKPGQIHIKTFSPRDSLLIFRSVFYPRWKVRVDRQPQTLIPVDHALSGVFLESGEHKVRFYYDMFPHKLWETLSVCFVLILVSLNVLSWRYKGGQNE